MVRFILNLPASLKKIDEWKMHDNDFCPLRPPLNLNSLEPYVQKYKKQLPIIWSCDIRNACKIMIGDNFQ
jgi:hypothetical protein